MSQIGHLVADGLETGKCLGIDAGVHGDGGVHGSFLKWRFLVYSIACVILNA